MCWSNRNQKHDNSVCVSLTSLILTIISISLLLMATLANTPWFSIYVTKQSAKTASIFNHTHHNPTFSSDPPNGIIDGPSDGGLAERFLLTEEEVEGVELQNMTDHGYLAESVWCLKSVTFKVPAFHNYSNTVDIDDVTTDPLVMMALSVGGFTDSVVDAQNSAQLVYDIGLVSLIPALLSILFSLSLVVRSCSRNDGTQYVDLSDPNHIDNISRSNNSHESRVMSGRRNDDSYTGRHIIQSTPNKSAFQINGSLQLVPAILGTVGLAIYGIRSTNDAIEIFKGVVKIFGKKIMDWFVDHMQFGIGLGLIEYTLSVVLLYISGLANLCVRITPNYSVVLSQDLLRHLTEGGGSWERSGRMAEGCNGAEEATASTTITV